MGRTRSVRSHAADMLAGSVITRAIFELRRNITQNGKSVSCVERLSVNPLEKGGRHFSEVTVTLSDTGDDRIAPLRPYRENNGKREIFDGVLWIEYFGSDNGWEKLKSHVL